MCGGIEYESIHPETGEVTLRKVYFPIPQARLPVIEPESPLIKLCQWGRRKEETGHAPLPEGGWARLISLKEGKWNRYHPKKVRIPALRWMEKDATRKSHWFDLPPDQAILGVLIEIQDQHIVYVVTRPAEGSFAQVHRRMPFLVPIHAGRAVPTPV
jgi:hypothetical protein